MRTFEKCMVRAVAAVLLLCGPVDLFAQQKLAQTGMKFLNVGTDARVTAMGEAFSAFEALSVAQFYNPASMARQTEMVDVHLSTARWIGDIRHSTVSATFVPFGKEYGVVGISAQFVDYGDVEGTVRANTPEGYLDIGTFSPSGYMVGIGYAFELSTQFTVGGNAKFVGQNLGTSYVGFDAGGEYVTRASKVSLPAFDIGVLYKTGYRSLNFGASIRNFSREARYEKEGFQLPLIFRIGLAMNMFDLLDADPQSHRLLLGVDATHPRDYPEQTNIGIEYVFMDLLALRGGFMANNDLHGVTAGVGVRQSLGFGQFSFDYAYTPFKTFEDVHRFTVGFTL